MSGPTHVRGGDAAPAGTPGTAPLVKWPGGKTGELPRILPGVPSDAARYLEPFVGGGAVLFAISPEVPAAVNDASTDLMDLYRYVQRQDRDFFAALAAIDRWWRSLTVFAEERGGALADRFSRRDATDLVPTAAAIVAGMADDLAATVPPVWDDWAPTFVDLARQQVPRKLERMRTVERRRGRLLPGDDVRRNVEGAFKAACYTTLRTRYNRGRLSDERSPAQSAAFWFLREYAYAAMFRFNRRGEFNVPYGGITYNRKDLAGKIAHLRSPAVAARLATTTLACEDFASFLERAAPGPDDFVFLDPPYDSDFSDYDANGFARSDHQRLAETLRELPCRFQLVIKASPAVRRLYADDRWDVRSFDKTYQWTIKDRNDRRATHLVITNRAAPGAKDAP